VAICDVASDMECRRESAQDHTYDKKASEVNFMKVFRVQEEVRNTQVFTETSTHHRKQDDPAKHQYQIPLKIVQ
jgi:hypothetical protein